MQRESLFMKGAAQRQSYAAADEFVRTTVFSILSELTQYEADLEFMLSGFMLTVEVL